MITSDLQSLIHYLLLMELLQVNNFALKYSLFFQVRVYESTSFNFIQLDSHFGFIVVILVSTGFLRSVIDILRYHGRAVGPRADAGTLQPLPSEKVCQTEPTKATKIKRRVHSATVAEGWFPA